MRSTRMFARTTLACSSPSGRNHDRPVVPCDLMLLKIEDELYTWKVGKHAFTSTTCEFHQGARIPMTHTVVQKREHRPS